MKGSRFLSVLLCAASLAVVAVSDAIDRSVYAIKAAVVSVADFAVKLFTGPAPLGEPVNVLPERAMHRAGQFWSRIAKRERPVLSASWRMCPSI